VGYNKIIISGENLELYEYENDISIEGRGRGVNRNSVCLDVESDRENTLSARQLGKRRDNARRAALAFKRLISSNLRGFAPPILVTVTFAENIEDVGLAHQNLYTFVKSLRYKFGKEFRYVAVPEFQKRGAIHFHIMFWGLPPELLDRERQDRTIAKIWGHGFVDILKTNGDDRLAGYLAKYMSKAFTDERLRSKKAYTASRNILRPQVVCGIDAVWVILDDYVGVDNPPILDRRYTTQWLGRGRYRHYKLSNI